MQTITEMEATNKSPAPEPMATALMMLLGKASVVGGTVLLAASFSVEAGKMTGELSPLILTAYRYNIKVEPGSRCSSQNSASDWD